MDSTSNVTADNDILSSILSNTNNDIVIFMVVILLILVAVGIPLYRLMLHNKKDENEATLNEKKLLIDVVRENTSAIASLKTTLELNNNVIMDFLQNIKYDTSTVSTNITSIMNNQNEYIKKMDNSFRLETEINDALRRDASNVVTINSLIESNRLILDKLNEVLIIIDKNNLK